jgi:hypothetical protein
LNVAPELIVRWIVATEGDVDTGSGPLDVTEIVREYVNESPAFCCVI